MVKTNKLFSFSDTVNQGFACGAGNKDGGLYATSSTRAFMLVSANPVPRTRVGTWEPSLWSAETLKPKGGVALEGLDPSCVFQPSNQWGMDRLDHPDRP